MEKQDQLLNLCRICTSETQGISIYSREGKENRLEDKIKKFLSIQISEEDVLPKIVCALCTSKLDSIHQLYMTAAESQLKLSKMFNKCDEMTDSESEDRNSEMHDDTNDGKGSLLHSILTNGQNNYPSVQITELEVTVDPMLFIEESEDETKNPCSPDSNSNTTLLTELKPYQCSICPRGFNSDVSLRNHLWRHLPSRKFLSTADLNKFQVPSVFLPNNKLFNTQCLCQVCGRVYPTRSTLRAHQITHSSLRPHKCSLCEKTFKRNQDLKFHINQHTGEKPYRCPYCPKAFASSGNCFSHRKRMHPKQLATDKKKSIN